MKNEDWRREKMKNEELRINKEEGRMGNKGKKREIKKALFLMKSSFECVACA